MGALVFRGYVFGGSTSVVLIPALVVPISCLTSSMSYTYVVCAYVSPPVPVFLRHIWISVQFVLVMSTLSRVCHSGVSLRFLKTFPSLASDFSLGKIGDRLMGLE